MGFVILGGGISGLTAAFYLRQAGYKSSIKILEATPRLGGWINSHVNENGTLFEMGPRTLRVGGNAGANTLLLAETLGLEDKIIPVTNGHPSTKNRMIQVNGKLHRLPSGFKSSFTKSSPFSKSIARMFLKDLFAKKVSGTDESLYSFAERRFGTEFASYIMDPLARGVFAGDARNLSILALARPMYEAEQKHGSVIIGMLRKKRAKIDLEICKSLLANKAEREDWSIWSLQGGLETLVRTLREGLKYNDIEILTNKTVENISFKDRELCIATNDGNVNAGSVISCLPAFKLKDIISNLDGDVSSILGTIPYVTVVVVSLEFNTKVLNEPAFGYLVPSSEPSKLLGVIFDSCVFPQDNKSVLTVMMGGHWHEQHFGEGVSEEEYYQIALREVRKSLDISSDPSSHKVSIMKKSIPQMTVGHFERIEEIQRLISSSNYNLHVGGNYIDGVGVNDAIYRSKKLVNSLTPGFS